MRCVSVFGAGCADTNTWCECVQRERRRNVSDVREIVGSNPGQVKPMIYQIDTCRLLARCSALLG